MSENEAYFGKLKEIKYSGAIEDIILKICEEENYEIDKNNIKESFYDEAYDDYVVVDDKIYKIIESNYVDPYEIFKASKNDDGTINFIVSYYNGGCGFTEAIEEALNNMENTVEY